MEVTWLFSGYVADDVSVPDDPGTYCKGKVGDLTYCSRSFSREINITYSINLGQQY